MADDFFIVGVPLEVTEQSTTPATPASGTLLVYPKTDDKFYKKTSAGVESEIGGGSGSTIPTLTATVFTVTDNTQALFSRSIVLSAGGSITVGINAALIHVS